MVVSVSGFLKVKNQENKWIFLKTNKEYDFAYIFNYIWHYDWSD